LIPVEAADVARRRYRRLAIWWGSALLALAAGALIYKHNVDPIHAQESYEAGVHLLQIARYPQAILSFDRAIDLKSNFAEAYLMRARAFAGAGQTANAISDYAKVIELHPRDPQPLIERGRVYVDGKDYQSAIGDAAGAIALDSTLAGAYALRGSAVRAMGNLESALKDFDHALKLDPSQVNYFERGTTYQMMNRHEEAIADFTMVIKIEPDAASGYYSRAKSERALGDLKKAEEDHHRGRLIDGR
jgi:tetratricopeptide (TPR) repeat protein